MVGSSVLVSDGCPNESKKNAEHNRSKQNVVLVFQKFFNINNIKWFGYSEKNLILNRLLFSLYKRSLSFRISPLLFFSGWLVNYRFRIISLLY